MADLTHHAVEGEGGHNDDGQETALGPMKKAHDVEKLGLFSESCGFDRMRASSVLGGGSWRSQLVPTPSMHQLTLLNRPVQSHHAPTTYICTTKGGGIGLPGHVLAPNEGSYS